jgi:hypothetical protein
MLGAFGQAIIVACLIAALGVVTPFVFLHAAHVLVTALTMSSGGEDRFRWPRESYYEWFGQGVVVFGILFIWSILSLIPVAMVFHFVSPQWGLGTWLAVVWTMTPISLCSVMMAPSRLLFLYPPLIGRLLRQMKGLLFVYFITAQLFIPVGIGAWLIVIRRNPLGVLVVSIALPGALIMLGRAWGRLAWLALNYDRPPPSKKKKKRKRKPVAAEKALDIDLELAEHDDADYTVHPTQAAAQERLTTLTEHYAEQQEYERALRERVGDPNPDVLDAPKVPTFSIALGGQLFSFLFDVETLGIWLGLGLACLLETTIVFLFVRML